MKVIGHQIFEDDVQVKDRDEDDYYPTPIPFIRWTANLLADMVLLQPVNTILDVAAGSGNWGKVYSDVGVVDGIELNQKRFEPELSPLLGAGIYRDINYTDFMEYNSYYKYDLVVSNPPYRRSPMIKGVTYTHRFVHRMLNFVKPGGTMLILVRTNFRNVVSYHKQFYETACVPTTVIDLAQRINFQEGRASKSHPTDYALFIWENFGKANKVYAGYSFKWR